MDYTEQNFYCVCEYYSARDGLDYDSLFSRCQILVCVIFSIHTPQIPQWRIKLPNFDQFNYNTACCQQPEIENRLYSAFAARNVSRKAALSSKL